MKRMVCLILLTALLMPLFAQGGVEEKAVLDMSAPVTLTIWTHEDANRKVLEQELIAEFMEMNPNVTVDYQTYPSSKMRELLTVSFSANQGPDIFNQSQSVVRQFVIEGRVSALDPEWIGEASLDDVTGRYIPGALAAVEYDGDIHGLPLEYTNFCTYLNKNIFRDAGLDPEKDYPKTWEEVMEVSKKLVLREGEIITRRGYDFRYPSYTMQFLPMVEQLGGKLMSDDGKTAVVGDEAWLQFFTYMRDWGPEGYNLGGPTYLPPRKVFDNNNNEIAMSDSGLYQQGRMKKANPDFFNSDDWMVIPFPQFEDAVVETAGAIACHYYMVNGQIDTLNQMWAWKLVDFMLSHSADYLEQVNLVQPTYELFESDAFAALPFSDVFAADMKKGDLVYFAGNSSAVNDKLKGAVESAMLLGEDPATVLENFRKEIQILIDDE